ncbi:MAG: hypothetical protein H7A32_01285 [Deltaproteobacteria bacterium]|nr:hypothetical protein [Deltaproteobacteria bacterium]
MADLSKAVKISIQIQEHQEKLENLPHKVKEVEFELQQFQEIYHSKNTLFEQEEGQKNELVRKLEEERLSLIDKEKRLNAIKTQKEFQAVSREISNLKNSIKEDEINLASLEKSLEELRAEVLPLEEKLAGLQSQYSEEESKISGDLQAEKSAIADLEKELQETLNALSSEVQQKYHRIASVCQPPAALVINGTCQECFIQLPPQLYIELQRSSDIYSCPSCRRLLYIDRTENN